MKNSLCHPPITMCCEDFAANFGHRNKRFFQDPGSGFVKEGERTLHQCPFCGAEIDPVVTCQMCKCGVLFSRVWVDNGRYLCPADGKIVRYERERRTDLGDAA